MSTSLIDQSAALSLVAMPKEHRVMGRTLEPFSLWHRFWLHQAESPLVVAGKPISVADLEMASRLCAEKARALPEGRLLPPRSPWWSAPERWTRRFRYWLFAFRILLNRYRADAELKKFSAYLESQGTSPVLKPAEGDHGEPTYWHADLQTAGGLVLHYHMTWQQAWSAGPAFADWLLGTAQRWDGQPLSALSDEEVSFREFAGEAKRRIDSAREGRLTGLERVLLALEPDPVEPV